MNLSGSFISAFVFFFLPLQFKWRHSVYIYFTYLMQLFLSESTDTFPNMWGIVGKSYSLKMYQLSSIS